LRRDGQHQAQVGRVGQVGVAAGEIVEDQHQPTVGLQVEPQPRRWCRGGQYGADGGLGAVGALQRVAHGDGLGEHPDAVGKDQPGRHPVGVAAGLGVRRRHRRGEAGLDQSANRPG
jgi:hypothetical protein